MTTWRDRAFRVLPWIGAALSGALLCLAFPPVEWRNAAWIAFVPLVLAVRGAAPRRACGLGFFAGVVFWAISVSWVRHVSVPGWITLALYCSLYTIPFAAAAAFWIRRFGSAGWLPNLGFMAAGTALWVGFEYLRSVLFTGFAWSLLGSSQYANIPVMQAARWGGAYAVSAIVMWVNLSVAMTLLRYAEARSAWGRRPHPEIMLGFAVLVFAMMQGWRSLRLEDSPTRTLRVSVVQPLIPQMYYYMPQHFAYINDRLHEYSVTALRAGRPDLLIWAETAIPDELRTSEESYDLVYDIVQRGTPLLVGSMDTEWTDDGPRYFNSSFLVDTNGIVVQGYDKRHLVMFGEYVPMRRVFPFLRMVTPITESFTPGTTSTVFRLDSPPVAFSVLICFEDSVAKLARESVRNGARLLVNQTNDGWFDEVAGPRQHMIQSVLRCVENGVPAVRAANTGVSCCIDRRGRVYDILDDGYGNTYIAGFRSSAVEVPGDDMPLTFYTRHGDWFALVCAAAALAMTLCVILDARMRRMPRTEP